MIVACSIALVDSILPLYIGNLISFAVLKWTRNFSFKCFLQHKKKVSLLEQNQFNRTYLPLLIFHLEGSLNPGWTDWWKHQHGEAERLLNLPLFERQDGNSFQVSQSVDECLSYHAVFRCLFLRCVL